MDNYSFHAAKVVHCADNKTTHRRVAVTSNQMVERCSADGDWKTGSVYANAFGGPYFQPTYEDINKMVDILADDTLDKETIAYRLGRMFHVNMNRDKKAEDKLVAAIAPEPENNETEDSDRNMFLREDNAHLAEDNEPGYPHA